jgi:hypothetical protein
MPPPPHFAQILARHTSDIVYWERESLAGKQYARTGVEIKPKVGVKWPVRDPRLPTDNTFSIRGGACVQTCTDSPSRPRYTRTNIRAQKRKIRPAKANRRIKRRQASK